MKNPITRRRFLKSTVLAAISTTLPIPSLAAGYRYTQPTQSVPFTLDFTNVAKGNTPNLEVASGYTAHTLLRWGDGLFADSTPFAPDHWTASAQQRAFGTNNDFLAYFPLESAKGRPRGLLHVNHEYATSALMFANGADGTQLSDAQMRVEMAALGASVVEISQQGDGSWQPSRNSHLNRRITAQTPMELTGPAAGHARLQTAADPSGRRVLGTFANCAGGQTPWGTVLMAEENFDGHFHGQTEGAEAENHRRYTIAQKPYYGWHRIDDRFNVARTPNEPNRFGWVVEYNPYDPYSTPKKRTALGRFKHETATFAQSADGRAVIYSGDDEYFEHLYRFVSRDRISSGNPDLLDNGTLSVARFDADSTLYWAPLIWGEGELTPANGFHSQADILIEARRAADLQNATEMDRPEGIAIHPQTGAVTLALTKNPKRKQTNPANPRSQNRGGHLITLQPPAGDHGADYFDWRIHVLAGNPEADAVDFAGRRAPKAGWFARPDNLAYHPNHASLWIATDGMGGGYDSADGLYAMAEDSAPKCLLRAPIGAEVTGPCFTPDGETLFLSIQHPAEGSSYANPSTRWPDFQAGMPPRSSVVVVRKK